MVSLSRSPTVSDCPCGKTNWKSYPHYRNPGEVETFCMACGWKQGCHPVQKPENARMLDYEEPIGEPNAIVPVHPI